MPKEKVIGQEMRFCRYCDRETMHALVERRMWFTLFFLPIFPVSGTQVIARCEACGLTEQQAGVLQRPEPQTYRGSGMKRCPDCGAEVIDEAAFCQFCGHRF